MNADPAELVTVPPPPEKPAEGPVPTHKASLATLTLGAIGVVFGDIGTSPLYTFQECVGPRGVSAAHPENVLGVCSLIFWALTLVVTVKYLNFLMRADNHGEGGIFALLALVPEETDKRVGHMGFITLLVIAGAALLFGDGIITPAISVLSALEGLEVATPALHAAVVPLTCVILFGLFALQRRGTGGIGALFGPVMIVWFVVIAVLGGAQVVQHPQILNALWPGHGVTFFQHHGWKGFRMLGSVVLAVTGGEALYADMGHFGRQPIRIAWLALIFPALVLCYFGQGALVLSDPAHAEQPFFDLVPHGFWTWALVLLSAPATVIASQALISGVFSLTHQGVQLGLFPRVEIRHTSSEAEGQIYVPALNWGLAAACIALVLGFEKSSRLAAAFGLAVSGTMAITSVVFFEVTRRTWKWPRWKSVAVLVFFLSFDLPFLAANLLKFFEGGYLPLLVGSVFFAAMVVWRRGRAFLAAHLRKDAPKLEDFQVELAAGRVHVLRPRGTAIFMVSQVETVPVTLRRHIERIGALHQNVVLLAVQTAHTPTVPDAERVSVKTLGAGLYVVVERFGFMEQPNIPELLQRGLTEAKVQLSVSEATYYIGRETFLATSQNEMGAVEESVFAFLARNAHSASLYFRVPPEQVVEFGIQVDL